MSLEQSNPDELVTCSWDGTIKFWNLLNGNCIRTLTEHEDGLVKIWDTESGESLQTFKINSNSVLDLILI